jgi:hypothetical protein
MKNKMLWTALAASAAAVFVYLRRKTHKAATGTNLPAKLPERHLTKAFAKSNLFDSTGHTTR